MAEHPIHCYVCGERYLVDESLVGRKVQCDKCHVKFFIEAGVTGLEPRALVICPKCHREHSTDPRRLGGSGRCTQCGITYRYETAPAAAPIEAAPTPTPAAPAGFRLPPRPPTDKPAAALAAPTPPGEAVHHAPLLVARPAGAIPVARPVARTSAAAVWSLVLGLLVFLGPLASIPAIICGHVGRGAIKKSNGSLKGAGLALAGLILGYVEVVTCVVLVLVFVFGTSLSWPFLSGLRAKMGGARPAREATPRDVSPTRAP